MRQNPYYLSSITTFDYLSSIFFKNNWKWFISNTEKDKINNILMRIGLYDKKNISIENRSGGEMQKINIALGLISGADVLLLDEPASNMDLNNQVNILKLLKELTSKNITIVIIMHDLSLAMKYGDNFIGITNENKIIQKNSIDFFTPENLKEIFNMNFEIVKGQNNTYVQILD